MALWDARGRAEGVLALTSCSAAPSARESRSRSTSRSGSPGRRSPARRRPLDVARYCARMVAEHDADGFEGKVATVALDEEVAMVREVRAAIGPTASCASTRTAAGRCRPRATRCGGSTPTTSATTRTRSRRTRRWRALRPATRASFSSHLTDLRKAVALGAPDTIVSNVNEFGGIRRTRRVRPRLRAVRRRLPLPQRRDRHRQRRLPAPLGRHRARARAEPDAVPLVRRRRDRRGPVRAEAAALVAVPTGPGLGVTLDPAALQPLPRALPHRGAVPGRAGRGRLRRELPPAVSDADQIAAALAAAGTEVCFGVPGGGVNLDLVGACGRHGIRFVLTHTETAAVIAAGVYGELTGTARPGALHPRAGARGGAERHRAGAPRPAAGDRRDGRRRVRAPAPARRPRRDGGAVLEGRRSATRRRRSPWRSRRRGGRC